MDAVNAGKRAQRLRTGDREGDPFLLRVGGLLEPIDDVRTEHHAGYASETLGLLGGANDQDAGDDCGLARTAPPTQLREPLTERGEIEDGLRLEEVRAGIDLRPGVVEVRGHRLGGRACGRAHGVIPWLLYLVF